MTLTIRAPTFQNAKTPDAINQAIRDWFSPQLNDYLEWISGYQALELQYNAEERFRFLMDMCTIVSPSFIDEDGPIYDARIEYLRYFIRKAKLDRPQGQLSISYLKITDKAPVLNAERRAVQQVAQDQIGLSAKGATSLWTSGFENCLAIILTPVASQPGAMLGHIREIQGALPEADTLQIMRQMCEKVPQDWGKIEVTLLMGRASSGIYLPELPTKLKLQDKQNLIDKVHDLRQFRFNMDQIAVDARTKQVYLSKQTIPETNLSYDTIKSNDKRLAGQTQEAMNHWVDEPYETWRKITNRPSAKWNTDKSAKALKAWTYGLPLTVDNYDFVAGFYAYD